MTVSTKLYHAIDGNDERTDAVPPASHIDARVLAANTAESHTVPAGSRIVVFSSTSDFYVNYTTTAAIPAADITNGSAPELNPSARILPSSVTTLSLISPTSCTVTMAFYA